MTGPVTAGSPITASAVGEPAALDVDAVSWRVGAVPIVDRGTLRVAPGEFVALIGPNGAGKTTLFDLVSGLRRPTAGRIRLAGADMTRLPPYRRTRLGPGRTFQSSAAFGSLSAADNVAVAAPAHGGGSLPVPRRRTAPTST